jgi:hypothetical protein
MYARGKVLSRCQLINVLALAIVPTWTDIVRLPLRGDWLHTRSWAEHLGLLALLQ